MSHPTYPNRSWFDPRLERRPSSIHGQGVFANAPIRAGERLMQMGGIIFTPEDWYAGRVNLPSDEYTETQIDEGLFLAAPLSDLDYWFNHSCDPTLLGDCVRRDIEAGEELTCDYATSVYSSRYRLEPCGCGSALCRGVITGDDWKRRDLQTRYQGVFPEFIEARIRELPSTS